MITDWLQLREDTLERLKSIGLSATAAVDRDRIIQFAASRPENVWNTVFVVYTGSAITPSLGTSPPLVGVDQFIRTIILEWNRQPDSGGPGLESSQIGGITVEVISALHGWTPSNYGPMRLNGEQPPVPGSGSYELALDWVARTEIC